MNETISKDGVGDDGGKEEKYTMLAGTDVDGVWRGKIIPIGKIKDKVVDLGFCGVIFSWDCTDAVYSNTELSRGLPSVSSKLNQNASNLHNNSNIGKSGYPDVIARVDKKSKRTFHLPQKHSLGPLSVSFVDFLDKSREPLAFCPRSTLKWAINNLLKETGCIADCGFELEWYNYSGSAPDILKADDDPHKLAISSGMFGYSTLRPWSNAEFMSDIVSHCDLAEIAIDCLHTETGPGVYEVALKHKPALSAADECQLFKFLVKTIAQHHGLTASFMAKPWNDFPGCGGHIHLSLVNSSDNSNAFAKDQLMMDQFIAGILTCLPDSMPFFAPNINSYKRLDLRYWAPILIGWGVDNRLAVVRVIKDEHESIPSTRIEIRLGGADLNPYYAAAAIIQAGLYGLQNKLKCPPALDSTDLHPNADLLKEINSKEYQALPSTLTEATDRMMAADSFARKIFPSGLIDHFGTSRRHEIKSFEAAVTDWERQRYLELA